MKAIATIGLFLVVGLIAAGLTLAGTGAGKRQNAPALAATSAAAHPAWEVPIASGVWYPTDGPVPENPVRYYRVRCWPGCHVGSSYGMFPKTPLDDKPIWPTSTINVHSKVSAEKPD